MARQDIAIGDTGTQLVNKTSNNMDDLYGHVAQTANPHGVTAAQVGLGNVQDVDTTDASNITTGVLPSAVLPPLAISTVTVFASEAAMLAGGLQGGDTAVRTDTNQTFIHNGGSAGTIADFTGLAVPADAIQSVAGLTGTITAAQLRTALNVEDGATADQNASEVPASAIDEASGTDVQALLASIAIKADAGRRGQYDPLAGKPRGEPIWILGIVQSEGTPSSINVAPDSQPNNANVYDFVEGAFSQLNPGAAAIDTAVGTDGVRVGHPRNNHGGPQVGMADAIQQQYPDNEVYITWVQTSGFGLIDRFSPFLENRYGYNELVTAITASRAALALLPVPGPTHPDVVFCSVGYSDNDEGIRPSQWTESLAEFKAWCEGPQANLTSPNAEWLSPAYPWELDNAGRWLNYLHAASVLSSQITFYGIEKYPTWDRIHVDGNRQTATGVDAAAAWLSGAGRSKAGSPGIAAQRPVTEFDMRSVWAAETDTPAGNMLNEITTNVAQSELYMGFLQFNVAASGFAKNLHYQVRDDMKIRIEDIATPADYVEYDIDAVPTYENSNLPATSGGIATARVHYQISNRVVGGSWTETNGRAVRVRILSYSLVGNTFADHSTFFDVTAPGRTIHTEDSIFRAVAHSDVTQVMQPETNLVRAKRVDAQYNENGEMVRGKVLHTTWRVQTTDATLNQFANYTIADNDHKTWKLRVSAHRIDDTADVQIYSNEISGDFWDVPGVGASGTSRSDPQFGARFGGTVPSGLTVVAGELLGVFTMGVQGNASETWEWQIDLWLEDLED